MAAVTEKLVAADTDFAGRAEAAQRALTEGIAKAGLQRDPFRFPLEALALTVSLFPELVQHLEATRQPVQTEEMRKAVVRGVSDCANDAVRALNVRNSLVGAGLLATALLVGAVGGYLFHGSAPVLVGVRAGAEQCQDRQDGSRMCWIPVFEKLPPPR
jgi:hypothetical protein